MVPSTTFRLEPLRLPVFLPSPLSSRRTPAAPAPPSPDEFSPSSNAANMSSSAGYVCSARSYFREIGRKTSAAAWYAWLINGPAFLGTSRLIMVAFRQASEEDGAFQHADGAKVAVPPLDRVLLDEAVSAQQLDAGVADLHSLVGGQFPGQCDLAGVRLALLGPRRRAQRDQAQALQL